MVVGNKDPKAVSASVEDALLKGTGMKLDAAGNGEGNFNTVSLFVVGVFDLLERMEDAFNKDPYLPYLAKGPCKQTFTREQCACIIAGGMMGVLSTAPNAREFDLGTQMSRGSGFGRLFPGSVCNLYRFISAWRGDSPFRGNVRIRRTWEKELTVDDMKHPLCKAEISSDKEIEFYKGSFSS